MISVHVEGNSWPEVRGQLIELIGLEPMKPDEELVALRSELVEESARAESYENTCASLRDQNRELEKQYKMLNENCSELAAEKTNLELELLTAKNKVDEMEIQLNAKDVRIADLKKQLAEAKAPQQSEPTEGDTETPAPLEEEEQTAIPEVTEAPVKEYKKEEVRAVLVKCRAANIALTDVLAPYGGSLGAVKPEDYAKVVEAAEKALEGK